jgi:alkyldihydroxyacetonephosphate synthase
MRLSDDGETRLSRALQRAGHDWDLTERIFDAWLALRRFDGRAAQMLARFSGNDGEIRSSRKRFEAIARRMGALALGVDTSRRQTFAARRDTLLDRGAALDRLEVPASWSELPSLYVALRAALKQAMRADGPRAGAHGLVLASIGSARPDGATITVTWTFPRKLDDEIAQAENIRRAAWAACNIVAQDLEGSVLRAIKQVLDPKNILSPGTLP